MADRATSNETDTAVVALVTAQGGVRARPKHTKFRGRVPEPCSSWEALRQQGRAPRVSYRELMLWLFPFVWLCTAERASVQAHKGPGFH